jgi:citrate lyase subunit beta / citryl-CoA lyase
LSSPLRYRSMLFVPGHRDGWAEKAVASGADAIILDLEDAVPADLKADARLLAAQTCSRLSAQPRKFGLWVRPNPWDSRLMGADLEAVVPSGVDGLMLPKVETKRDVHRVDALLDYFEARQGVMAGTIRLLVTLETAEAMAAARAIAKSSKRVWSVVGGTGRDGDISRALGFSFSTEGSETLYLRSKILLASRTAGLDHPVCGIWQDVADTDGLRRFAQDNRNLGYRGQVVIHPSHVPIVNEAYGPKPADVEYYVGLLEAHRSARARGQGAATYAGQHIDEAHYQSAIDWLRHWSGYIDVDLPDEVTSPHPGVPA